MCIDRKQFIATADGTGIRLFPENYGILHRLAGITNWTLDIDKGVDKALALLIFGEYHTNHKLKWGTKAEVLGILEELIADPEPEDHTDTEWGLFEKRGGYHIWQRWQKGTEIFNCTITNCEPQTRAGYADLEALLKLKGVD